MSSEAGEDHGPFAQDAGEVAHVVRDEDALLLGRERQHIPVVQSLERQLLIKRTDIVARLHQPTSDPRPGDVRVEQEPHGDRLSRAIDLQEGIKRLQLRQRATVLREQRLDLLGETPGVRPRQAQMPLVHERMVLHQLVLVASV